MSAIVLARRGVLSRPPVFLLLEKLRNAVVSWFSDVHACLISCTYTPSTHPEVKHVVNSCGTVGLGGSAIGVELIIS